MERRDVMSSAVFIAALLAVVVILALFKIRVAVASGKLVLGLLAVLVVVWFLRPRR